MKLTYLWYYIGVGAVVLTLQSAFGFWRRRHRSSIWPIKPQPYSWKMRLANVVLIPLAIVFLLLPLWPWAFSIELGIPWHKLKFWPDKVELDRPLVWPDAEPDFEVAEDDLLEIMSRSDIEAHERVHDPMNAVPDLPFGHLHAVWQAYIETLKPGCELWSFCGRWKTQYSHCQMDGYVARRGQTIGPHFLTSQKPMRDN
ncbi:MAG: hypothetical protein ABIQ90_10835 [Polaromonas sp.]